MSVRRPRLAVSAALMLLAAVAGCSRSPYPEPSMTSAEAGPPPPSPPELMGAPEGSAPPPYPPSALPPAPERPGEAPYPPLPPAPERPGDMAGPDRALPPPPITMAPIPNPPERGALARGRNGLRGRDYNRFSGPEPQADRVIAMTPIPNPVERGAPRLSARARPAVVSERASRGTVRMSRAERRRHARLHRRTRTAAVAPTIRAHIRSADARSRSAPVAAPVPSKPSTTAQNHATAKPHESAAVPKTSDRKHVAVVAANKPSTTAQTRIEATKSDQAPVRAQETPTSSPAKVAATPAPSAPKPAPAANAQSAQSAAAPTAAKPGAAAAPGDALTTKTPSAAPSASRQGKLAAFSGALGSAITGHAALSGVDALKEGEPGDVTLTLPQDLAGQLKSEAKRAGLSDAAASAAVTAKLAGEGYAISPAKAQSQPLTSGKPVEFRWSVTKLKGATEPLKADVGAELLGGGKQRLELASVSAPTPAQAAPRAAEGFKLTPRVLGIGLLMLVVLLGGALMGGNRRRNEPDRTTDA